VAEDRAAQGRRTELPRLEDVDEDAVGIAVVVAVFFDPADLGKDQALRLPQWIERANGRGIEVDRRVALGPVGIVDAAARLFRSDEIMFLIGERALLDAG
jgi:hypothetical protein